MFFCMKYLYFFAEEPNNSLFGLSFNFQADPSFIKTFIRISPLNCDNRRLLLKNLSKINISKESYFFELINADSLLRIFLENQF